VTLRTKGLWMEVVSHCEQGSGGDRLVDAMLEAVWRPHIGAKRGATPAWLVVLLGFGGLALGLALVYFFSSCPLPPPSPNQVQSIVLSDGDCAADVASLTIRPPKITIPIDPLSSQTPPQIVFEMEALGYTASGGGIPLDCILPLVWGTNSNVVSAHGVAANRGQVTVPATGALSAHVTVTATLGSITRSAEVEVVSQDPSRDVLRADYSPAVAVALVDGYFDSRCYDGTPVSFVSVGLLPNLTTRCSSSHQLAAFFGAGRSAWHQKIGDDFWDPDEPSEVVNGVGLFGPPLEKLDVAVWIAINGPMDGLTVHQARQQALADVYLDEAWTNAVFKNERAGMVIDVQPTVVGDAHLDAIFTPANGDPASTGMPRNVDAYVDGNTYDANAINVYYVGEPWGNLLRPRNPNRTADVIFISWRPSSGPGYGILAHEIGHVLLGLGHSGYSDNLMNGSQSEWTSRLTVGQLFFMNFSSASWATLQFGRSAVACEPAANCPSMSLGVGH